jgi:hypothetical protein
MSTDCAGLSVKELFRQCDDFGQSGLTYNQLNGTLSGHLDLVSVWNAKLEHEPAKLFAVADIKLINGELNDYKPLESLSSYVNVNDLRKLRFSELTNHIEIRNEVITIPAMQVRNNALNLEIAGTHTFSNYLDYKLKLKLSDLLHRKRKAARAKEFEEEEDDPSQGMNLFISMKGPVDNLVFSYDKRGVVQKIKQDLGHEKENIRKALQKELGLGKDSTIREKQTDSDELEFEPE